MDFLSLVFAYSGACLLAYNLVRAISKMYHRSWTYINAHEIC